MLKLAPSASSTEVRSPATMAASAAANASAAVNTDTFPGPEGLTQAIVKFLSIMMWRLRYT